MGRRNWTRDELIAAFNLYCKLPFGQLHSKNPRVAELAGVGPHAGLGGHGAGQLRRPRPDA